MNPPVSRRRPAGRNRRFNPYSLAGIAIVGIYVLIFALFRDSLPDKWSVDSAKIIDIINYGGAGDDLENSFAVTAALFAIIGVDNLDVFTCLVSTVFLFFATRDIRRASDFFSRLLLIVPCILLNMFSPSKETFVLIMTMLITFSSILFRTSRILTVGAFLFLYVVYGIFVRQYYLLIAAAFIGIYYLWHRPLKYYLAAAVLVVGAIMVAPASIVQTLQSPRDTSNAYADQLGSDNRTAFTNLVPPTSGPSFLVNYVYATTVLIVPVLYFQTPGDFFMQLMIGTMLVIVYRVWRKSRRGPDRFEFQFFTALFVSHILIQIIFEPDLGSFTRHLSSVILYLIAVKVTANQPIPR